jgi:hypothetical protein
MNLDDMYRLTNETDLGAVLVNRVNDASYSLGRIANDVSSIRNAIWADSLFNFFNAGNAQVTTQYIEIDSSANNSANENLEVVKDLGAAVEKVGTLSRSAVVHGQEAIRLLKELEKLGLWFVHDVGLIEFLEYTQEDLDDVTEQLNGINSQIENSFETLADEDFDKFVIEIKHYFAPILSELAKQMATADFCFEIAVSILKGCIALKRVDLKYIELQEDTQEIREKMESGELKLPFNLSSLEKTMEKSRAETAEFRQIGQQFKESQVLITGDPAEMTVCRDELDHRASIILDVYADLFTKFNELKRIYEAYWIKNN